MSETEEDPDYDSSSSDANETLSADPHVASELKMVNKSVQRNDS